MMEAEIESARELYFTNKASKGCLYILLIMLGLTA